MKKKTEKFCVKINLIWSYGYEVYILQKCVNVMIYSVFPYYPGISSWYNLLPKWTATSGNVSPTYAPREDSDQPAHSRSLIWIFSRRILNSQGYTLSSYGYRRFKSDCADAQADFSLRWAHVSAGTFSVIAARIFLHRNVHKHLLCIFYFHQL